MIDFYIGLRFNQSVVVCGPALDGKSTLWKVIAKAINSVQTNFQVSC